MQLRPYQAEAIGALKDFIICQRKRRIVIYSPTGSGKTEIGIDLIRTALGRGNRILFCANRIELVKQTSRRLRASNVDHGIIQGSNTSRVYEPVLVGSIQSLSRRGYPEADLIIVDEAHGTAGSNAYCKLMEHFKDRFIVGLTATPFAKGMAKAYPWGVMWEGMIAASTIQKLIDQGFLVDVDIFAPSKPDLSSVRIVAGDYDEHQLGEAVDKPKLVGDIVDHWKRLANNKPTVCFATNINHSKHIVEQFTSNGIPAEHIDCFTKQNDRDAILGRVVSGETKVISNVGVLAEGWDFPACEVLILARPTRSLTRYIQMAGRILRPAEGKTKALILDHSDTCVRLGFPTDDLPLDLDDGKPNRSKNKKAGKDKDTPLPIVCPQCSAVVAHKHGKCPRCGYVWPVKKNNVEVKDGDLVKIKKGKVKKGKIVSMPTPERERVFSELLGYAAQHNYKSGWAYYKSKELFGSAPRRKLSAQPPTEGTLKLIKHLQIKNAHISDRAS